MIVSRVKAVEAAAVLGVNLDTLTEDELKKAYRGKTKECHPDLHGTRELHLWSQVSWAYEALKHWLKTHPVQDIAELPVIRGDGVPCRACEGSGRIPIARSSFGKPLTMQCVLCEGTGEIIRKEDDSD